MYLNIFHKFLLFTERKKCIYYAQNNEVLNVTTLIIKKYCTFFAHYSIEKSILWQTQQFWLDRILNEQPDNAIS